MNDNERALLRYVVEGDIRKSQQQAKIVLEGLTTVKDKAFKETCLRTLASKSPTLIELPYNLQGLLVAEDSSTFREDRFLIRDDEKAVIVKMCKTRRAALQLQEMGIHYTSSLLLMGEPGTGKTELARYIAYTTNLPFVYTNFSGMVNSALGKTQKNIGMVFDYARKSPCVLCLDEIDAIGTRRGGKDDVAEMNRVTIALMQELDRLGNDIILVGTTNRPDTLDDALLRRFTFGHTVRPLCRDDARTLARMFFASVGYSASDAEIESHSVRGGSTSIVVRCRMPTDSQKINRQTGAAPEGIRKSRHQSRMVLKNIGEDTAQNPPGLLPDGAGREVGFLAEG